MRIAVDVLDGVRYTAVIDSNDVCMLYARPDDARPWTGDVMGAKVLRYAASNRAYFIELGNGVEGFLPHKDAKVFAAGTKITVTIERPATLQKQARCSLATDVSDKIGLIAKGEDDVTCALRDFPDSVVVQTGLQDFDAAILALGDPIVSVAQGLEIVIEHTAALTAIDINNADPDLKPFEANRLCMVEILRQMRLRNMSGQILIDLLRLQNPDQRQALQGFINDAARLDPKKIDLYGFTRLGLFEMTRTKIGLPLQDVLHLVA